MRGSRPFGVGGIVVLGLLAIGVAVVALRPGSTTIVVDDTPPVDPPADGTAVVAALRAPGGLALFGWQIVDPTHTVEVRFLAGPGCSSLLTSGDLWPAPHPECADRAGDVAGEVAGLGITVDGDSIVGVEFSVPGGCFDRLELNMPWPPGLPDCIPDR